MKNIISRNIVSAIIAISCLGILGCKSSEGVTKGSINTGANTETNTEAKTCADNFTQKTMLDAVNKARSEGRNCGQTYYPAAKPLSWNGSLAKSASLHAQDMSSNNYFEHASQDGRKFSQRIVNAGYPSNSYKAENIYAGTVTLDAVMSSLLKSEYHCQNIMSDKYKDFGMACSANSQAEHSTYWVQNFGGK